MEDKLILVNYLDEEIGSAYKLEVHKKALLHRAFSIFIFNGDKLLIQKRAENKYHSGGLWANTCCSHPRVNETLLEATARRLEFECGIKTELNEVGSFIYHTAYDNGLSEYEYDHVFIGEYSGELKINKDEIAQIKEVEIDWLLEDIVKNPFNYASWFKTALEIVIRKR